MKVLIGTPCYDGKLHVRYIAGLVQSLKKCPENNIQIDHLFIPGCAILHNARNIIFKNAYEQGYDVLVFIDADIGWDWNNLLTLIESGEDVVGGAYRLKNDTMNTYALKKIFHPKEKGVLKECDFIGTGFMAISRKAMKKMFDKSPKYSDGATKGIRMVFDFDVKHGELAGEDTFFCRNWRKCGGKVWVNTDIRLDHIGEKVYHGDITELKEAMQT